MPPGVFEAASVILSLIVIESLLSVDNALGIAAFAGRLPERERRTALRLGFVGAYLFRVVALLVAKWISENHWVMVLGAVYLIYLMCSELTARRHDGDERSGDSAVGFWPSVWKIGLMDLSLSVDNVVTAVAFTNKMWLIYTGVLIGIVVLRFFAGYCLKLLEKYPILEKTAFLLVGYVGLLLLAEMWFHFDAGSLGKFAGVVAIVALSFFYANRPALQRFLAPAFAMVRHPMHAFARLCEAPMNWLVMPVIRLIKRRVGVPQ